MTSSLSKVGTLESESNSRMTKSLPYSQCRSGRERKGPARAIFARFLPKFVRNPSGLRRYCSLRVILRNRQRISSDGWIAARNKGSRRNTANYCEAYLLYASMQLGAISRWAVFQIQLAGAYELVESGGHVFQETSNPEGPGNSPIPAV